MPQHPSSRRRDSRPSAESLMLHIPLRHLFAPLERCTLGGRFRYSAADPFVVRLDLILDVEVEVTWFLGRDMFAAGLLAPSGDGDIRVWPSCGPQQARLFLRLRGTDGEATFEADLEMLRTWLDRTYQAVPAGTESGHVDWDAVADLLGS
jgi:hypothetical protein